MKFKKANSVEQIILDGRPELGWKFVSGRQPARQAVDLTSESLSRDALIRLNPEIAPQLNLRIVATLSRQFVLGELSAC